MQLSTLARLFTAAIILFSHLAIADDLETLNKAIAKRFPAVKVDDVKESQVPGLYQVIAGSQVVYIDKTGRYMIDGDLVDMDTRTNLTDAAKSSIRVSSLSKLDEDEMLVYQPEDVKYTVTVVTDINCPYCRKLHSEMDEYMDNHIKVRYLLLPLKGKKDYETTVSVWCAEDRNLALDIAKAGGGVDQKTCPNPLAKHKKIANELGVSGTPAIILQSGRMLPGYVPVNELLKVLKSDA